MIKFKSLVLFLLMLLVINSSYPLEAQNINGQPRFTSAFTDLSKECQEAFKTEGEGQDIPLNCKGYGQYHIYIYYSAFASHISINTKDKDDSIYLTAEKIDYSDEKDSKIEWRFADGKPFAVILKVSRYDENAQDKGESPYQDKNKIGESLLIKGLKGYEHIDFKVEVNTTLDAVIKARELADYAYLKCP